jgi:Bacterial Ig domain
MHGRVRRSVLALAVLSIGASLLPGELQACGVERWSVKTGTDADAGLINLSSTSPNTILTMRSWTAPNPIPANNRVAPYETTVWVLNATLTEYKLETDQDYHLVLSDASGNTMIAEIPDPVCVGAGSPLAAGISNARAEFDAKFTATSSFQTANVPVRITGVGMFDFLHGQTGVAPNGIELHPVVDIVFNPSSNPDFALAVSPASLSAAQGGAAGATVSTTVAGGFNAAVALSASGQPAGVTVAFSPASIAAPGAGSSTMTVTVAASAAAGSSTITVSGAGGGKTHTAAVGLTVTAAGGGGGVVNGGFETGSFSGWTPSGQASVLAAAAHGGSFAAQVGSTSASTDSLIAQTFTMPAGSPSLSFWYDNHCPDTVTYDWATATLKDNVTGATTTLLAKTCAASAAWTQVTYNAAANAGHSVTLTLANHDDNYAGDPTYTWYDDVAVTGAPADTTPPTTAITAPANGATVSGTVAVTASASDNVGVTRVEIYLDSALQATLTSAPYTWSWNTTTAANGTHAIVSKAYDAAGNVGTSATVTVTVSNSSGGQQLLGNPGFENGASTAPWTASSGVIDNSSGEPAHTGSWKAWLDGYGTTHTDTLQQTVTLPAAIATATLSFWLHVDTAETSTTNAYDTLTVQIRNASGTVLATLATYSNLNANTGYVQKTFDVSSFKGQTIQVYLVGAEDSSLQTSFVVDDFALNVQ